MLTTADDFRHIIEKAGLVPPDTIIENGKLHRFASNGEVGDDAGWYVFFSDEPPAGKFGCWRAGLEQAWSSKADATLTPTERDKLRARFEKARRQREQDEQLRHAAAAARAQAIWDAATPAPKSHPYLQNKGVQPYGVRLAGKDRLIVPVMIGGKISSLQAISMSGEKLFLPGGKMQGGSFSIGELSDGDTIMLCEGYATAASLHEACGLMVVMAFSANNLEAIAVQLRRQYPTAKILVCGDNDLSGTGQREAHKAAEAVRGVVVMPNEQGQDWNDVHAQCGLDVVQSVLEAAILGEDGATMKIENLIEPTPDTPDEVSTTASRAIFRRVADVQAMPIRWLWPGRIAQGKVSMIAGNPGLGKSQVTVGMAATVSTGGPWPVDGERCDVGNVIILSAEDDPSDTIRPRLEAAGADLSRVYILDAVLDGPLVSGGETPRAFNLKTDIEHLGSMLREIGGAALVIIDPITAYLGTTDSHKNAEIRALLSPLAELAGQYGAAVVAVSHFNKNASTEALMRVTGSLAFVAAARAAYVVARDPEHEARRLFLPLKNNLGNDQTGLAFTVESAQVESSIGMIETSRVVWESSAVTVTAEEAMRPQVHDDERSDQDDARDFLLRLLDNGPVPSNQIERDAKGAGHSMRTVQRAKKDLGVVAEKQGMKEGWCWRLPKHSQPEGCQGTTKNAVSGDWQPSHSSGSFGSLHGDDTVSVKGGELGPSSKLAATDNLFTEVEL